MKLPAKVYAIECTANGKVYIGMSSNVKHRWSHHLSDLRAGRHRVPDMQEDYNKYGECFSFSVVDEVNTYADRCKEFKWQIKLKTLDRRYGYNYRDPVTKWYNRGKEQNA